jgi:hypothetical protein
MPNLRQHLYEAYVSNGYRCFSRAKNIPIQIDDQDDSDNLAEFCNIFVHAGKKNKFTIEISGQFPITGKIADLAEIYAGKASREEGLVWLTLQTFQYSVIFELADIIRQTANLGEAIGNPGWNKLAARTASSLHRFIRIIEDFEKRRTRAL